MINGFKIVDVKNGEPYTLFHGINRSRKMPKGVWIDAEEKMVCDGANRNMYLSGFHFFRTIDLAHKYLKRFKHLEKKEIVPVLVKEVRPKPTNPEVMLAKKLMFLLK